MWCPSCGAEYRDHVVACSDCLVALVAEEPQPLSHGETSHDHTLAEWQMHDWDEDDLKSLFAMLNSHVITYEWDPTMATLRTNHLDETDVDELLALFDEELDEPLALSLTDEAGPERIAGLGRRIGGFIVDTVLLGIVTSVAWRIRHPGPFSSAEFRSGLAADYLGAAFVFTYHFVSVAVWGRTIGKLLFRTRVVDRATEESPNFLAAALRSALPTISGLVPFVGGVAGVLIYGAAIVDEQEHQGFHDRLAGTIVVEANR